MSWGALQVFLRKAAPFQNQSKRLKKIFYLQVLLGAPFEIIHNFTELCDDYQRLNVERKIAGNVFGLLY